MAIGTNIPNEVTSRGIREESWCRVKHLLHAEGHIEEEIANASRYEPDMVRELAEQLNQIRELRQKAVKNVLGADSGSGETRSSSSVESESCPRCSADLALIKKSRSSQAPVSDLYNVASKNNTVSTVKEKEVLITKKSKESMFMADVKALLPPIGGQFVGAAAYDTIRRNVTQPIMGYPASTLVNLVGGLVLSYAAMEYVESDTAKEVLAVAGTHMVGRQLYEVVAQKVYGGAGMALSVRAPLPMYGGMGAQRTYPGTKVQIF